MSVSQRRGDYSRQPENVSKSTTKYSGRPQSHFDGVDALVSEIEGFGLVRHVFIEGGIDQVLDWPVVCRST